MNCSFYLALERLPMSLVAAIEFVGTIGWPLIGLRSGRNLAGAGDRGRRHLMPDRCQVVERSGRARLGGAQRRDVRRLRRARPSAGRRGAANGVANLGAAMIVALLVRAAVRLRPGDDGFLLAAAAWSPPSGSAFARRSSLISATSSPWRGCRARASRCCSRCCRLTATLIGVIVLAQIPASRDLVGIALVMVGVAIHKPAPEPSSEVVEAALTA